MAGVPSFEALFRLDGKTALITGGSTGIGYDIAAGFMQAGAAKVIIASRKKEGLEKAVKELNSIPNVRGKAVYVVGNVSTMDGVDEMLKALQPELVDGKLHILVNNAGASWAGLFETYDDWKTAKTFDVNVRGPFNLTRRYKLLSVCCCKLTYL